MQQEHLLMGEWLDSLMYENWGAKALKLASGRTVATDGRALVLVDGVWSDKAAGEFYEKATAGVLAADSGNDPNRSSFSMPLATLRAWLPSDPFKVPCSVCRGGEIKEFTCKTCRGEGVTECGECGSERECRECGGAKKGLGCEECEGDGALYVEPTLAPVVAGGVCIDQRIAQRFLGPLLQSETVKVTVGGELEPVFIHGDGWTVVVMAFKWDESHGPLGEPLLVRA
jgi:hypothetical protein